LRVLTAEEQRTLYMKAAGEAIEKANDDAWKADREAREAEAKEDQQRQLEARKPKQTVYVQLHGPHNPDGTDYRLYNLPERYLFDWAIEFAARWARHPVRSFLGLFAWPSRAYRFLRAQTGGKVSEFVYGARMATCGDCDQLDIVMGKGTFCRACGCGFHRFADLQRKNRLRKWYCPLRRHEGPYPDDRARDDLVRNGYADKADVPTGKLPVNFGGSRTGGGCSGCGTGRG
jgi:hypothetical protein